VSGRARKEPASPGRGSEPFAAAESGDVYRLLVEQSPVGIVVTDVEGRITKVNPSALETLGSPSEEATRQFNVLTMPNLRQAGVSAVFERVLRENCVERLQTSYSSVWGKTSDVSLSVAPLRNASGAVVGALALIEDVTAPRRVSAERLALLEVAQDLSAPVDLEVILDRVQERVAGLLPCDRVGTYYWDAERGAYVAARDWGLAPELEAALARLEAHLNVEFPGTAPLVINDIEAQSHLPAAVLRELEVGALVIVPLQVRGRARAAVAAVRGAPARPFTPAEVQLFEGIARQLGLALERADLDRAQQQEAAIAAALARVGKDLIASFNRPGLVERVCRLTADVLECDLSCTLLLREGEDVYAPAAQAGASPEWWEGARALRVPAVVEDAFEQSDVVALVSPLGNGALALVLRQLGLSAALAMALRRGGRICALQVAGYRGERTRFEWPEERIAAGVAQLASFALENARLLSELESASRLKSDFVATMSHELRTPLNAIVGYCDLLLDGAYGELQGEQAGAVKRLQDRGHELFELITATLDVSRLEAGQLPLDLRAVDIAALLDELQGEAHRFRLQPGVVLRWQAEADLPVVRTDAVKVKVILKNLLSNAAKFTARGSITVGARVAGERLELSVADTGVGIGAEEQRHIFEAFRQVDSSNTRRFGGVGLGLYIVRRLLELLAGSVEVESELGKGTVFRVLLPL